MLQSLLKTTDRVVQEIDSVEYGLTDIQEYYANTGALKKAAEGARGGRLPVLPANFRMKWTAIGVIWWLGPKKLWNLPAALLLLTRQQ